MRCIFWISTPLHPQCIACILNKSQFVQVQHHTVNLLHKKGSEWDRWEGKVQQGPCVLEFVSAPPSLCGMVLWPQLSYSEHPLSLSKLSCKYDRFFRVPCAVRLVQK